MTQPTTDDITEAVAAALFDCVESNDIGGSYIEGATLHGNVNLDYFLKALRSRGYEITPVERFQVL